MPCVTSAMRIMLVLWLKNKAHCFFPLLLYCPWLQPHWLTATRYEKQFQRWHAAVCGSRQSKDLDVQLPCSSAWGRSSGICRDLRQALSAGMLCSAHDLQKYSRCDERNKWNVCGLFLQNWFCKIDFFIYIKNQEEKKKIFMDFFLLLFLFLEKI